MDKDKLVSHIKDIELKIQIKNILDICNNVVNSHITKNTKFLTPNVITLLDDILPKIKTLKYKAWSLNENAERKIMYFYKDYKNFDEVENVLSIIKITNKNFRYSLNHRDFLGSILSKGVDRETIGDILVDNNNAYVILLKPIDEYLKYNLDKVKNCDVEVDIVREIPNIEQKFTEIIINVSSMRLDSIVSKVINISREKAQNIIQSGDVRINFDICKNNSKIILENTTISIRGYGKFIIDYIISETKKQRLKVAIKKYSN